MPDSEDPVRTARHLVDELSPVRVPPRAGTPRVRAVLGGPPIPVLVYPVINTA
jgi:hypothetical protein